MRGQRHRDRQVTAKLAGLVESGDTHDVTVRREAHSRTRTQAQLIEGAKQLRVRLNRLANAA